MPEGQFERLGRYEIKRVLGKGAMGDVYLAVDPVIGREVAIKVVQVQSGLSENEAQSLQKRFELEFRLAGSLSHPNIVTIHDVGRDDGSTFVAMEYIRGETLQEVIADGSDLTLEKIVEIGRQISDALDHAHEKGVIHRDVKPANIMLTRRGLPKLTDFGIAKVGSSNMTQTGMIIGTPAYMSPEQITGHEVTPRSDQFAMAVILYEMLTGRQPFKAESPTALMFKIVHEAPPDPLEFNPALPTAAREVVSRALSKDPAERFETCREMIDTLEAAIGGHAGRGAPAARQRADHQDTGEDATTLVSTGEEAATLSGETPRTGPTSVAIEPDKRMYGVVAVVVAVTLVALGIWYAVQPDPGVDSPEGGATPTESLPADPPDPQLPAAGGATASSETAEPAPGLEGTTDGDSVGDSAEETSAAESATDDGAAVEPEVEPVELTLTSEPAGASILVGGEEIGAVTPSPISVLPDEQVAVRLELDGYEAQGWSFSLDSLTEQQRADRAIHFTMTPSTPPGQLVLQAPYPVQIRVAGRSYGASGSHAIDLREGTYQVRVLAPDVFLDSTQEVTISSNQSSEITVPDVVTISVFANPSNCMISIDGREVNYSPLNDLQIVVGRHTFQFDWQATGDSREVIENIRRDGQRVFGEA